MTVQSQRTKRQGQTQRMITSRSRMASKRLKRSPFRQIDLQVRLWRLLDTSNLSAAILAHGRRNRECFSFDPYKFLWEQGLNIPDFVFHMLVHIATFAAAQWRTRIKETGYVIAPIKLSILVLLKQRTYRILDCPAPAAVIVDPRTLPRHELQ
ncbi:hypothetical protein K440DRAFT_178712 [Wilcoxina mikolae CBS 423.85]|nr:hypothetical protein K440DRAFT_178712 [Wilcoxina mikolae CBS 423.85]